jgi:hypothetical protein
MLNKSICIQCVNKQANKESYVYDMWNKEDDNLWDKEKVVICPFNETSWTPKWCRTNINNPPPERCLYILEQTVSKTNAK